MLTSSVSNQQSSGTLPSCFNLHRKSDVSRINDLVFLIKGVMMRSKNKPRGDKTESVEVTMGHPGGLFRRLWILGSL